MRRDIRDLTDTDRESIFEAMEVNNLTLAVLTFINLKSLQSEFEGYVLYDAE